MSALCPPDNQLQMKRQREKDEADWMKINLLKESKKMPCAFSWAFKRIFISLSWLWRIANGENTYSSTRCCVMQKALHLQWTNIALWIMESRKAPAHENIHDSKKIAFLAKNCISWFLIRLSGTRAFSFTAFGCDSAKWSSVQKMFFRQTPTFTCDSKTKGFRAYSPQSLA